MRDYIKQRNTGSTVPLINLSVVKNLPIPIPPIKNQDDIVSSLIALDNEIELNNKMNQTLEQIVQAIFKHWFIDFEFPNDKGKPYKSSGGKFVNSEIGKIPEGWKTGRLSNVVNNIKQPLNAGEEISDRQYVPIECLSMNKLSIENTLPYTEAQSSLIGFEKGDILMGAMRVYFHRVNIAGFKGVTRTTTFVLRPKEKLFLSFALLLINRDETIDYANSHSKGTTMPYAVWTNSLDSMEILIPKSQTLNDFNKFIMPILEKLENNRIQNQTLSQLS